MEKNKFVRIAVTLIIAFSLVNVQSQEEPDYVSETNRRSYSSAAGLRFGETSGLSLKHKFSPRNTGELIAGRTNYSYGLTALYEYYLPTTAEGLTVYFGGGGHIGKPFPGKYLLTEDGYMLGFAGNYNSGHTILGVDGIFGLEFLLGKIPMSLSAEFKPYAEFFRHTGSSRVSLDPGVGLRYHF